MQLYLIRHAQSENNALYVRTGSFESRSSDPGLSEVGQAQAHLLGRFLKQGDPASNADQHDAFNQHGFDLTHLYCSLLRRSIETALAVSSSVNIPVVADVDLHEWGGVFEISGEDREYLGLPGPNRSFFEESYPEVILPESLGDEGWWDQPHEPRQEAYLRAGRFLKALLAKHGGSEDNVALVTHAGFYHSLLTEIAGLPLDPDNERWMTGILFAMNNAAVSRISFVERGTIFVYLNRADYLPRELVT
jgi:2,3-bisphosphoglycerate-dependent phosphoglycerate mutase